MYFGCIKGMTGAHSQGETEIELNNNLKEVISMLNNDNLPVEISRNDYVDIETFIHS